jgi:hypothetical protein
MSRPQEHKCSGPNEPNRDARVSRSEAQECHVTAIIALSPIATRLRPPAVTISVEAIWKIVTAVAGKLDAMKRGGVLNTATVGQESQVCRSRPMPTSEK